MYPPSSQYSRIPISDPESDVLPAPTPVSKLSRRRRWLLILGVLFLINISIFGYYIVHGRSGDVDTLPEDPYGGDDDDDYSEFEKGAFALDAHSRPSWYSTAPKTPLVLRVAIMTRVDAYERRQTLRDSVLTGVPASDVAMEYHFFVGKTEDEDIHKTVDEENQVHRDITVLDIDDIYNRLSEKRYAALKWGGSVSKETYDYFMTVDSDTFVRFGPLARRLHTLFPDKPANPRNEPILIGRMGSHLVYFNNTVLDGNKDPSDEDVHIKGPWYSYPSGIGYMLSSSLVHTLLSTDPPVPHHIHYPSDDVMIGSWIASLTRFHDPTAQFETPEESPNPGQPVYPTPIYPDVVNTMIVDDVQGWHDLLNRGGHDAPVSWDSVCVHHMTAKELRAFRARKALKGEWTE